MKFFVQLFFSIACPRRACFQSSCSRRACFQSACPRPACFQLACPRPACFQFHYFIMQVWPHVILASYNCRDITFSRWTVGSMCPRLLFWSCTRNGDCLDMFLRKLLTFGPGFSNLSCRIVLYSRKFVHCLVKSTL